jgi:hypothetical protein
MTGAERMRKLRATRRALAHTRTARSLLPRAETAAVEDLSAPGNGEHSLGSGPPPDLPLLHRVVDVSRGFGVGACITFETSALGAQPRSGMFSGTTQRDAGKWLPSAKIIASPICSSPADSNSLHRASCCESLILDLVLRGWR